MPESAATSDAMKSQERIGKLFLLFLNHPRGLSFAEVRSYMTEAYRGEEEANRKKFQRDREALKKLGLHLELDLSGAAANDEDRVYVPAATARTLMRELKLSEAQRSYLMGLILRHMNATERGSAEHALCRSLYLKLFYNETDSSVEAVDPGVQTDPLFRGDRPVPDAVLRTLQDAMMDRRKIKMVYESAGGSKERLVQPLALNIYRRMWYLTAYCETARGYRMFQIDRITSPEIQSSSIDSHPPEIIQYMKPHPLNLRRESLQAVQLRLHADHIDRFDHFIRELPPGQRKRSGQNLRDIVTANPDALFFWMFKHPHAVTAMGPAAMRDRFQKFLEGISERGGIERGVIKP